MFFSRQDLGSGPSNEADDSSDSDSDSSVEDDTENNPPTHPTQGVKRAAPTHHPRETKTLKPNNL